MPKSFRPILTLLFPAILALSLPAHAQEIGLKDKTPHITTMGSADKEVVPDIATISLGIVTERPKAADAAGENAKASQAVVDEIKAQGIEARDIRTTSVTLSPIYDEVRDPNGRVTKRTLRAYSARNELQVRVRSIDKAGALARQLIDKGANNFNGIFFSIDKVEAQYDELRTKAMQDALRKAKIYAEAVGLKLGRVLEIQPEGGPVPMPRQQMMAAKAAMEDSSASAAIPVEPGVQRLTTQVQVTWELIQ